MVVNINDWVRVELTPEGRAVAEREKAYVRPDGHWQLWELMQTFGPHIWHGMPAPLFVENRVEIVGPAISHSSCSSGASCAGPH
jgi:hypothetical protein